MNGDDGLWVPECALLNRPDSERELTELRALRDERDQIDAELVRWFWLGMEAWRAEVRDA